ncbi:GTPase, partial [Flavobacterium sp.]|uniref:GTPase n=1 Tax=Flavobacterium sp. TaxID=239 RepID=UPI0025C315B6
MEISKKCPELYRLSFSGNPTIKFIGESSITDTPTTKFPRLVQLEISDCRNLEKIEIEAPSLRNLIIHNCPNLVKITIKSRNKPSITSHNTRLLWIPYDKPSLTENIIDKIKTKISNFISFSEPTISKSNNSERDLSRLTPQRFTSSGAASSSQWDHNNSAPIISIAKRSIQVDKKIMKNWLQYILRREPNLLTVISQITTPESDEGFQVDVKSMITPKIQKLIKNQIKNHVKDKDDYEGIEKKFFQFLKIRSLRPLPESSLSNSSETVKLDHKIGTRRSIFLAEHIDFDNLPQVNPLEGCTIDDLDQSNIDNMFNIILEAEKILESIKGKRVIALFGETGCGKSTLANWLLGCIMKQGKRGRIEAIDEKTPIGHKSSSETLIPSAFELIEDIFLVDLPGFLDNRSPEADIAHAVNIRRLFQNSHSCNLCLIVDYHTFKSARGKGVNDLLLRLEEFVKKTALKNFQKNLLIGFTKVYNEIQLSDLSK